MIHHVHLKMAIFLIGAPGIGKYIYWYENLKKDYEYFSAREFFSKKEKTGLRAAILQVISILKKGKKCAIDAEFEKKQIRKSYIDLILEKVPDTKFKCYWLSPEYGIDQLRWAREHQRAIIFEKQDWDCQAPLLSSDLALLKWLNKDGIDPPDPSEGLEIENITVTPTAESFYKFEVPALFIQYEGAHDQNIVQVIKEWTKVFDGVVIIIAGYSKERCSNSGKLKFNSTIQAITQKLDDFPIYIISVDDTPNVSFLFPPNPGIIAFLQRALHLKLSHRGTVYLYKTVEHQQCSSAAGIKYCKVDKVLRKPRNVVINTTMMQPDTPKMVSEIRQIYLTSDTPRAKFPLCDRYLLEENEHYMFRKISITLGISLMVVAQSQDTVESFMNRYQNRALAHYEQSLPENQTDATYFIETDEDDKEKTDVPSEKNLNRKRTIPDWMTGVDKKKIKISPSKQVKRSDSFSTLYVMTPEELIETAKLFLNQPDDEKLAKKNSKEPVLSKNKIIDLRKLDDDSVTMKNRINDEVKIRSSVTGKVAENRHKIVKFASTDDSGQSKNDNVETGKMVLPDSSVRKTNNDKTDESKSDINDYFKCDKTDDNSKSDKNISSKYFRYSKYETVRETVKDNATSILDDLF